MKTKAICDECVAMISRCPRCGPISTRGYSQREEFFKIKLMAINGMQQLFEDFTCSNKLKIDIYKRIIKSAAQFIYLTELKQKLEENKE